MDETVDWALAAQHMWQRHSVLLEWAIEAHQDPYALIQDPGPAGRSGQTLRVLGYSPSAGSVIVIVRHGSSRTPPVPGAPTRATAVAI